MSTIIGKPRWAFMPEKKEVARVTRCLFGEPDHKNLVDELSKQFVECASRDNLKWNFDFAKCEPLTGRYEWEKIVPSQSDIHLVVLNRRNSLYRSCKVQSKLDDVFNSYECDSREKREVSLAPLTALEAQTGSIQNTKARAAAQRHIREYFSPRKRIAAPYKASQAKRKRTATLARPPPRTMHFTTRSTQIL